MLNPDSDILTYGNSSLLNTETGVILNSRHGKFPKGSDAWVRNTISAVKSAVSGGKTIVASVGMNTWEIVLWACGEYGGNAIIILPISRQNEIVNNAEYFMQDYGLKFDSCAFCFVKPACASRGKKAWRDARDKLAVDLGYEIMPVSIRKDSRRSKVLENSIMNGKTVNREFQIKYNHNPEKTRMVFEMSQNGISYNWDYITHWTRRFCGPWSSEKPADYYKAITNSYDKYPRGADATLNRILSEKLLRGSSVRIKNGKHAVGFTDLPPHEAVKLMKWRKRYCRYTFEPYGIAIRKEAAIDAGIKPVTYIDKTRGLSPLSGNFDPLSQKPDEYTQTCSKGEWWRESEWRFIGSLDLSRFASDDIRVLIPFRRQFNDFSDVSGFEKVSLDSIGIKLKSN